MKRPSQKNQIRSTTKSLRRLCSIQLPLLFAMLGTLPLILERAELHAQPIYVATQEGDSVPIPHPDDSAHLWVKIQDSSYVYLQWPSGDSIASNDVSAAYSFEMAYDSAFVISYDFAECRRNSGRLKLRNWLDNRMVNANARLLNFNSGTDTFTLHTGDTLSFYRNLFWKDLLTGEQDTANYYALDSLDYTVELVRVSDSVRIATLDTIGILSNIVVGPPLIHGTHPLMTTVQYVVPASSDGVKAFIRILLFHRGNGAHWFTRMDHITIGLSARLNDSDWQHFMHLFNPQAPKIAIDQLITANSGNSDSSPMLNVVVTSGKFVITFDRESNAGRTLVCVFDASGRQLYSPYVTAGLAGSAQTEFSYPTAGVYFIALYHNGRLVRVQKMIGRE